MDVNQDTLDTEGGSEADSFTQLQYTNNMPNSIIYLSGPVSNITLIIYQIQYCFSKRSKVLKICMHVWCYDGIYFFLRCFPSCSSPRNSTASIIAAQVGGGCTSFNQVWSISRRQLHGSRWFISMLSSLPSGIRRRTPNIFHLSATLWQRASIKSISSGLPRMVEHSFDPEVLSCVLFAAATRNKVVQKSRHYCEKSDPPHNKLDGFRDQFEAVSKHYCSIIIIKGSRFTLVSTFCWVQNKTQVVFMSSGSIQDNLVLQPNWCLTLSLPLHHQFTLRDPLPFCKFICFPPSNLHAQVIYRRVSSCQHKCTICKLTAGYVIGVIFHPSWVSSPSSGILRVISFF